MQNLSFKSLFIIVLFLLIPIVFLLRLNQKGTTVLAEWWNDSWTYRQAINISSHSVGETNVYIIASVNIGTTIKAQTDDGDFRFTTATGQLLDYYISSGAGTTAPTFHINFDSFAAGAQTIYAYYGNPSATNGFNAVDFPTQASSYALGAAVAEEVGGGPIAWWKFDEGVGTTAYDSTSNAINGTRGGGTSSYMPSWQNEDQCISGKCLYFDGTDDYLDAGNNSKVTMNTSDWTFSTWIKWVGGTNPQIISEGNYDTIGGGTYSGWGVRAISSTGTIRFTLGNTSSSIDINSKTGLNDNKWHHITFTIDRDGVGTPYTDGAMGTTTSVSSLNGSNINSSFSDTIGADLGTSFPVGTNNFKGFLDDVRIYPYARSAAQIKKDYASGLSGMGSAEGANVNVGSKSSKGLSDGLVGYWKFDEGVGTTSADSSGNGNLATFAAGTSAPTWTGGKFGIGTSYDGSNDYIYVTDTTSSPLDVTTGLSEFAWIYITANGDILGKPNKYKFAISSSKIIAALDTTGKAWDWATNSSNTTLSTNTWYHAGFTYSSSTNKVTYYLNGQPDGTDTSFSGTINTDDSSVKIGYGGSTYFTGNIDEIRIYNRALSPTEIKDLYNFAPGPVAYWDFNEGTGTTAYDSSGNSNNGVFGTGNSSPSWITGKYGKALSFDGNNDYVNAGNGTVLNPGLGSFTVEMWTKVTHMPSGNAGILTKSYSQNYGIYYTASNDEIGLYAQSGSNHNGIDISPYYSQWVHLTWTVDNTNDIQKSYVNGIFNNQTNYTISDLSTTAPFNFGRYSPENNNYFTGLIDDVKIYNYVRTPQQIISDMNAGNSPVSGGRGAVAYYKFDEGQGSTTANWGIGGTAINGALGSGSSSPTWAQGKINKSLSFDGNDYVDIGSSVSLPSAQPFSVSTWINRASGSGNYPIGWYQGTNGFLLYDTGTARVASGGTNYTTTTTINTTNSWNHLVMVFDGTYLKTYHNGVIKDNISASYAKETTGKLHIGNLDYSSGQVGFFNGLVDEVKIYNYALSADEVKSDYNAGASFVFGSSSQTIGATTTNLEYCVPGSTDYCATPVAEWKMDEKTGAYAYDTSGNGNVGTVTNATWTQGKVGAALNFDGNGDYVVSTTNPSTSQVFTTSFWFNTSTPSTNMYLLDRGGNIHWFELYNSKLRSGTSASNYSDSTTTILANTWYFASMTYDGTNVKQYINGIQQFNIAGGNVTPSGLQLSRYYNGGTYFNGQIDQVKIYNYARTPAQVAYDYNKGGPVGWWKMDECQGTTIADWSGNANHGTLSIGASGTQNSVGTCSVGTSAAWINGSTGKLNSSINLDGLDDYIKVTSPAGGILNPLDNITLSAWVNWGGAGTGTPYIISKGWGDVYELTLSSGRPRLEIVYDWATSDYQQVIATTTLNQSQWYHLVGTYDKQKIKIYINGVLNNTADYTKSMKQASNPFKIGANHQGGEDYPNYPSYWHMFKGQIDDVRIYNYALTSTQVKTLYNGGSVNFR